MYSNAYGHGLYSYGLYSYGLYSYGLANYRLHVCLCTVTNARVRAREPHRIEHTHAWAAGALRRWTDAQPVAVLRSRRHSLCGQQFFLFIVAAIIVMACIVMANTALIVAVIRDPRNMTVSTC